MSQTFFSLFSSSTGLKPSFLPNQAYLLKIDNPLFSSSQLAQIDAMANGDTGLTPQETAYIQSLGSTYGSGDSTVSLNGQGDGANYGSGDGAATSVGAGQGAGDDLGSGGYYVDERGHPDFNQYLVAPDGKTYVPAASSASGGSWMTLEDIRGLMTAGSPGVTAMSGDMFSNLHTLEGQLANGNSVDAGLILKLADSAGFSAATSAKLWAFYNQTLQDDKAASASVSVSVSGDVLPAAGQTGNRPQNGWWVGYAPDDRTLLTLTVYSEARGESVDGQAAVAQTILNRMNSDFQSNGTMAGTVLRWGAFSQYYYDMTDSGYEQVAFDNGDARARLTDMLSTAQADTATWNRIQTLVTQVQSGTYVPHDPNYNNWIGSSLQFVNPRISSPVWAVPQNYLGTIGNHAFYRH